LVRGGISIPFHEINAASGPGLRFNLGRSMLAKPPNIKRAVEYLAASGAVSISVTELGTIRRQCRLALNERGRLLRRPYFRELAIARSCRSSSS
jgi:hypothetical protein